MKMGLGILLVVIGAVLGLYAGVWVCFIGGIVDVIDAIRADVFTAIDIAIGVAKVFFAGFIGWVSFMVVGLPGLLMIKSS